MHVATLDMLPTMAETAAEIATVIASMMNIHIAFMITFGTSFLAS